jgi:HK97 family phage prohead protease
MNHFNGIDMRALERGHARALRHLLHDGRRLARSKVLVDDVDEEPRLCIEGLAILFETPILNKYGETIIFEPTAFDKYFESDARPPFWQGHDAATAFGSNTELCILNEGVAFRLPLTNPTYAAKIREMVESGERACISIGFTEMKTRNEEIFGHPVKMIEQADLREISLVPRGACKQGFARVIDANHEPPLNESVNSEMFGIEYGLHNIKILKEDNEIAVARLRVQLSTLEAGLQYDEPTLRRTMTANESNRLTTERYEQLAANTRRRLCICR